MLEIELKYPLSGVQGVDADFCDLIQIQMPSARDYALRTKIKCTTKSITLKMASALNGLDMSGASSAEGESAPSTSKKLITLNDREDVAASFDALCLAGEESLEKFIKIFEEMISKGMVTFSPSNGTKLTLDIWRGTGPENMPFIDPEDKDIILGGLFFTFEG